VTATHRPNSRILVGLPYSTRGVLLDATRALVAPILISAGSCYREGKGLLPPGDAAWMAYGASLDSAGFTAMMQGGYRWSVDEYVDFVVRSAAKNIEGDCWGFPWSWWSAMDYCCEQEIAADRAEVERRIDATIASLGETLSCVDDWRDEGAEDLPDPLPILQGRTIADYVRCADGLTRELRAAGRDGLPELVGVGSVCRRQLHGSEGLLPILSGLDRALPSHVRLHLFGVKGDVLAHLGGLRRRVASVDSMAWDFAARMDARKAGASCTVERRAAAMRDWYRRQVDKVLGVDASPQLALFGAPA
jgi:hypothetical protein